MQNYTFDGFNCRRCGAPRYFSIAEEKIKDRMGALKRACDENNFTYCPNCTLRSEMERDGIDYNRYYLKQILIRKLEAFKISLGEKLYIIIRGPLVPYSDYPRRTDVEGGNPLLEHMMNHYAKLRQERFGMLRAWAKAQRR